MAAYESAVRNSQEVFIDGGRADKRDSPSRKMRVATLNRASISSR
jgi:hypothetical protein